MQRNARIHLLALAGALALTAGLARPARAQVTVAPFVAPSPFYALPGNGAVLLSWLAVPNPSVVGYNVYRREAGQAADKAVLMNPQPLLVSSALDTGADGKGLPNGKSFIYSVKAVYTGADGKAVEGPATRDVVVTPHAPIGRAFFLYDIETLNPGSAVVDNNNVLTIRGSGAELWNTVDQQSFLAVPVLGDFQATVKLLERPTKETAAVSNSGKIGLQIKFSLLPGDLYAYFFASVQRNPEYLFEGRKVFGGGNNFSGGKYDSADARFPAWLRLVRQGAMITAFLSFDGTTFEQIFDPQDFGTIPPVVYVGITAAALSDGAYVIGKLDFASLKIENVP